MISLKKLSRYYHTLKYVKPIQIRYQIYYRLRKKYREFVKHSYPYIKPSKTNDLYFSGGINSYETFFAGQKKREFTFLNLSHSFEDKIDWNFQGYGKLWTYNLNYFDYLNQKNISKDHALTLIEEFLSDIENVKDALEPFPISLRGINWIKFLTENKINDSKINDSLYAQYAILMDNLEYHLLGNHLLENGFSLLFGAYYFGDEILLQKAKEILIVQLNEQILEDGAHFELAPMYHQIMLFRLLDCINLLKNNQNIFDNKEFLDFLTQKAVLMSGWLLSITYDNANVPHFNDSTNDIAPSSKDLFSYAKSLNIEFEKSRLKECGYRRFDRNGYELIVDVGNIGPDYIPGHAHSDTFNFELVVDRKGVIVDTGISTYETNERRSLERSTKAHNTVVVNETDQSQVWSSFRVARRAKIVELEESESEVLATHDGYKRFGVYHTRKFIASNDKVEIVDKIKSKKDRLFKCVAYFHLHPEIKEIKKEDNKIIINCAILTFKGSINIEIADISIAEGYNNLRSSKCIKVTFLNGLETQINIVK